LVQQLISKEGFNEKALFMSFDNGFWAKNYLNHNDLLGSFEFPLPVTIIHGEVD